MKHIILIVLIIILLLMCSCKNEFSFRDHHFGDSIEQVEKVEGESGEVVEGDNAKYLHYSEKEAGSYSGNICYVFQEDKLCHIMFGPVLYENKEIAEEYDELKNEMGGYGSPDIESEEDRGYKALWQKDEYGIVLVVTNDGFITFFTSYPDKAEKFYNTMNVTDLTRD